MKTLLLLLIERKNNKSKKKRNNISFVSLYLVLLLYKSGAEGNRTPDPQNAILVLSQLSYSPKVL